MGDPQEKPLDHPQAELGLSLMWPELGSNPQRWDDKWFRALKISVLNHLATGAASHDGAIDIWNMALCAWNIYNGHNKWIHYII